VEDFGRAAGEINQAMLESLRGRGIVLPFPQREIRLVGPADCDDSKRHEPTQDVVSSRD
jgi:small-conductance mechanosensitive channel